MTAAKYSTYDPVYVRTYCTTRTQTAVIDLLGLSHAAHLVLIVIGRLLGGAVLRCAARRIIAFIRILYDFC